MGTHATHNPVNCGLPPSYHSGPPTGRRDLPPKALPNRAELDRSVMNRRIHPSMWLLTPLLGLALATAAAAGSYEEPPINYNSATPADPVARLQKQIDAGRVK